jgi:HKD family nuclease
VLLKCKETKQWRLKLIHDEWLNMNKEVAYRKIMKIRNKVHLRNLGTDLEIVKNKMA